MADNRVPTKTSKYRTHTEASLHAATDDARRWTKTTVEQKKGRYTAAPVEWPQPCNCQAPDGQEHTVSCMKHAHRHNINRRNVEIIKTVQKIGKGYKYKRNSNDTRAISPPPLHTTPTERGKKTVRFVNPIVESRIEILHKSKPTKTTVTPSARVASFLHNSNNMPVLTRGASLLRQAKEGLVGTTQTEHVRHRIKSLINNNHAQLASHETEQPTFQSSSSGEYDNSDDDESCSERSGGHSTMDVDSLMRVHGSEKSIYSTIVLAVNPGMGSDYNEDCVEKAESVES